MRREQAVSGRCRRRENKMSAGRKLKQREGELKVEAVPLQHQYQSDGLSFSALAFPSVPTCSIVKGSVERGLL